MEESVANAGLVAALVLGLLLGLKHATDADHVVAVSTIVSEYRNAWRGLWVGASWGLGHTIPLLLVGITILLLRIPFPEQYSLWLEFGVGIMLVLLGVQVFWNIRRRRIHIHGHTHQDNPHLHLHSHEAAPQPDSHHAFFKVGKPFFRLKSFVVGMVHGLAGSAAVMLLILTSITSFWVGLLYISLFGIGTILSMGVITLLMGIPFSISGRFERVNRIIQTVAGTSSIIFGVFLMYQIGMVQGLLS